MKFLKQRGIFEPLRASYGKMSLKNRLWLFQLVIVLIILACIFIIASSSGIIADLSENPYEAVTGRLNDIESALSNECLNISNSTVELAKKIDKSIQKQLNTKGLDPSQIKNRPELIEEILSAEVEKACFAMDKSGVTGVFVFLGATVNPALERAKDSKAGFFIISLDKNPEPYEGGQLYLLYGPVRLARDNNMHLHTQWELEFNVAPDISRDRTNLFKKPFEAALLNAGKDVQNLGYWSPLFRPADNTDKMITFSVPLLDAEGKPYGICGLAISRTECENILRHKASPEFEREVIVFSTQADDAINMEDALIYGVNTSWLIKGESKYMYFSPVSDDHEKLSAYYFTEPAKDRILGYNTKVRLYPGKSVFRDEKWALSLVLPKSDVTKKISRLYYALAQLLLLFIASIFITLYTSKYCIDPILDAIKKLKDNEPHIKTNIVEIDDLIKFLTQHPETPQNEEPSLKHQRRLQQQEPSLQHRQLPRHDCRYRPGQAAKIGQPYTDDLRCDDTGQQGPQLTQEQYRQFEERLLTLSNAERRIFDLYIEGHDAKEICKLLYISINTLKTHNRRIYTKMNVSSRVELLKYCNELMGGRQYPVVRI